MIAGIRPRARNLRENREPVPLFLAGSRASTEILTASAIGCLYLSQPNTRIHEPNPKGTVPERVPARSPRPGTQPTKGRASGDYPDGVGSTQEQSPHFSIR